MQQTPACSPRAYYQASAAATRWEARRACGGNWGMHRMLCANCVVAFVQFRIATLALLNKPLPQTQLIQVQ